MSTGIQTINDIALLLLFLLLLLLLLRDRQTDRQKQDGVFPA